MRAGQDAFSHRQTTSSSGFTSALWQNGQASGICHGWSPSRPLADHGPTTFGMMSPPFSMSTRSPSRMSRRATSCSLCSVAIEIGRAAEAHGLEHGERRHRAGAPDVDVDAHAAASCACSAGNLKATAHRGNFAVVPSSLAQRQVVELDDDAVGFERQSAGAPRATRAQKAIDRVDAVAALPVRLDRTAPAREQLPSDSAWVATGGRRAARHDDLIGEGAQAALARRRPDRACGWRPRPRCADWQTRARPRPPRSSFMRSKAARGRIDLAADLDRRRRAAPFSVSGIARMTRTFGVTSSPSTPSPRVTPRTSRPCS